MRVRAPDQIVRWYDHKVDDFADRVNCRYGQPMGEVAVVAIFWGVILLAVLAMAAIT